jgi:hypothetical protein
VLGALGNPSPATFFLGVAISAALSMAVFAHANKRGNKRATAWGVVTFLIWPTAIVYLIRYWMSKSGRRY